MAERIEILVTPERTKPKGGDFRNSTGKFTTSSREKVLPHYLRASTGSCHDFCKYGRKHAFEAKEKHRTQKGITATPSGGENPVNSASLAERKKKPVIKLRHSSDPKTQLPDKPKIVKREVSSPSNKIQVSSKQALSPANKVKVSAKQAVSRSPAKRSDASAKPATVLKSNSVAVKPSSLSLNLSGGLGSRVNKNIKTAKNMGVFKTGEKKALLPATASVSPKPSVSRDASLKTRKYRDLKAVSLPENQNKVKKAKPKLSTQVREKTLYVIEQPENKSFKPDQNGTHTSQLSPYLSSSSSSTISLFSLFSPSPSSYVEEENEDSESTLSEANDSIYDYEETESKSQFKTLHMQHKKPGRGAMVHSEDKDCTPRKLNFRRGKVVNPQSEKDVPRRLRFRQGRVLGENQNGKDVVGRRSFRRREVTDGDQDGTNPDSKKVVLRHQEVQGKKDTQGLLNNVIEETASKLVETRKSKVKALVGAFETVISLQESKHSTTSSG